ncbi:GNAT family N-acetyltransferase [Clostridium subterminale]
MFKNWATDSEVFRFFSRNPHSNFSEIERVVKEWSNAYVYNNCYNWSIELKEIGEVIGQISIVTLNEKYYSCDVAYNIGKSFWGKGITVEALKAVTNYMFKEVGINRIEGKHNTLNTSSGIVMQKSRMKGGEL